MFVVEAMQEDAGNNVPIDNPEGGESKYIKSTGPEREEALADEQELLEEVIHPGKPFSEAERQRKWLRIPRNARIAIRKLHNQWGHKPKSVLKAILKQGKAHLEQLGLFRHPKKEA